MKEIDKKNVWLIMTKCRKYVAKGTTRNRELVEVDNKKCKKRYLTYSSKGMAESAFRVSGFSTFRIKDFPYKNGFFGSLEDNLEAVECEMVINTL